MLHDTTLIHDNDQQLEYNDGSTDDTLGKAISSYSKKHPAQSVKDCAGELTRYVKHELHEEVLAKMHRELDDKVTVEM